MKQKLTSSSVCLWSRSDGTGVEGGFMSRRWIKKNKNSFHLLPDYLSSKLAVGLSYSTPVLENRKLFSCGGDNISFFCWGDNFSFFVEGTILASLPFWCWKMLTATPKDAISKTTQLSAVFHDHWNKTFFLKYSKFSMFCFMDPTRCCTISLYYRL